jgi:serine protease AprX
MNNKVLVFILAMILSNSVFSQVSDYWVFYRDKAGVDAEQVNFDKKAIDRRIGQNIVWNDTDKPVNSDYVRVVAELVTENLGSTRWFNASYVKASKEEIDEVKSLDFVRIVEPAMVWNSSPYADYELDEFLNDADYLVKQQVSMFYPEFFDAQNITAKGVRVAVLDGGFPSVDTHEAFQHLRDGNQIIDTYDFVKDETNAFQGNAHGTMVLSCIAGKYKGERMGLAQNAEFLLARTEKSFEPFKEEIFWLRGMEWADEKGADIINSSLGYTFHRYFQTDMDGKTSLISRAANMAAAKGILVVNAAGNEGDGKWHSIGAPADADSILSVGGVDPKTHIHISFSSYGPTADGRLKPNISASGKAHVAAKNGSYTSAFGTSFASPLAAGFVACAKQAFPDLSVMELKAKIESSGSLFPYFDYAHGYGIPDAGKLLNKKKSHEAISISQSNENVEISLSDNAALELNPHHQSVLFYHILNPDGSIAEYQVVKVFQKSIKNIPIEKLTGKTLQVHYNAYTTTKQF